MACVTNIMMVSLINACKTKKLRASSSHSVYSTPIARIVDGKKLYVAAGGIQCFISEGKVHLQPEPEKTITNANMVGDGGVWLSITSGDYWLEIHVPEPDRNTQTWNSNGERKRG